MVGGESASYNKLVSAAAEAEGMDDSRYKEMLETGKKVISAVSVDTDKRDKRELVHGLAMDAIDEWDARRNQEALQKKAEKKGMTIEEYKEDIANGSKAQKVLNKLGGIAKGLFCAIPNGIKRSRMLDTYKNTIEQAIDDNDGNLAAGSIAIEEMLKEQQSNDGGKLDGQAFSKINTRTKERLDAGEGDDFINALIGRAEVAADAGEDNEDIRVKFKDSNETSFAEIRNKNEEELTDEDKKRKAFAEYTEKIARENNDDNISAAKEELAKKLSELDGDKKINNYEKMADKIANDIAGALNEELDISDDKINNSTISERIAIHNNHQEALAAIDKYLDQTVSINEATVSTGLAAKEVYTKLGDKSVLNNGVIIGTVVSLGATAATMLSKSKAVQAVGGGPAGIVVKTALAGAIGGIRGYRMEGRRQRRENIKRAVGANEANEGQHIEATENQFSILNAEKLADDMQALIDDDGKLVSKNLDGSPIEGEDLKKVYDQALNMIADIKCRNELQNKEGIQLIGYSGRENIEQEKLEMFKAMTALKRAMRDTYPDKTKEDIDNEIADAMNKSAINDEFREVTAIQAKDRLRAAGKGALYAGATAFALTSAIGLIGGEDIFDDIDNDGGDKPEKTSPAGEAAPVLIEEDPQGGLVVGVDSDGDGHIDTNEYLRGDGEGSEKGVDLTDDKVYESVREELAEKYNINLEREAIEVEGYSEMSVGEYMENAENKVDNSGGVDWARSETKVAIGQPSVEIGDGMDSYEVPVWGVNGQEIPDGAKLYVDLDGDGGSGNVLEFTIEDGKAVVPADIVDTSNVGNGGAANFIGTARVGEMDGNTMIEYATAFGEHADSSTMISAASGESGFAFTAVDIETGEGLSQFAVDDSNRSISNLSEIFNGIQIGDSDRLPATFIVNDVDGGVESTTLGSGEKVSDLDYRGGYHPEYDSFENKPFIESKSYLGTPIEWDANGDGVMSSEEEASYFKQMLVRTGTNPNMLGQNASNYGLLEPDRLESIIPRDKLVEWGITDGVVDSEAELNTLLDNLKEPENADYYDSLVNETINEMETAMQGGSFRVETIHDRLSTYANSERDIDTARASIARTAIYPMDADGNPVGNEGWWCRKYGVEGGWVADMPDCNQKGIEKSSTGSEGTGNEGTGNEGTGDEGTGNEGTGNEGTGDEGTGNEGTGNEGTGDEPTGDESTGDEPTGDESTGNEGTGDEGTGDEGTGDEGTGDEGTGDESTGKNEAAERENAGSRVDQRDLNEDVTPKTDVSENKAASEASRDQVQSGNNAGSAADKQTQQKVDSSSQANNNESSSKANDTASERSDSFENRDY